MDGQDIWPDDVYRESALRVGRAMLALLAAERRWVHRRVEVVDALGPELARRSTSIDFTVPELFRERLRLTNNTTPFLVPIATLRKGPLRNFDVRQDGKPVSVLGKRHNGVLARALLHTAASRAAHAADAGPLGRELRRALTAVAVESGDRAEAALGVVVEMAQRDPAAAALLSDDIARQLMWELRDNYILITELPDVSARQIVKFAYDDQVGVTRTLGPTLRLAIETPAARHAASYHLEVAIPDELRVSAAVLFDRSDGQILDADFDADRASLLTDVAAVQPRALIELRHERRGFPTVALSVAAVTTGMLGVGALVGDVDPERAGPAISVLLAGSALFAGGVARSGEHRIVGALIFGRRLVLVAVAIAALAAVASLAFALGDCTVATVWDVAAATSLLCTITLGYNWYVAAH